MDYFESMSKQMNKEFCVEWDLSDGCIRYIKSVLAAYLGYEAGAYIDQRVGSL